MHREKHAGAPKGKKSRVELVLGITEGNYYLFNSRSTKRLSVITVLPGHRTYQGAPLKTPQALSLHIHFELRKTNFGKQITFPTSDIILHSGLILSIFLDYRARPD
jgi:hypothetical protein